MIVGCEVLSEETIFELNPKIARLMRQGFVPMGPAVFTPSPRQYKDAVYTITMIKERENDV